MLFPTITLAALPHVASQPLAYLYLSQIPYTGLELGPVGTILYWLILIGLTLALAYLILFGALPFVNSRARAFGMRVLTVLNARKSTSVLVSLPVAHTPLPAVHQEQHSISHTEKREAPRGYSTYDGFKSFAKNNGAISIEDIVKGLSRKHPLMATEHTVPSKLNVEPIYEHIEPIYENVEPITVGSTIETISVPADVRGFTAALVEGDRAAVFAGLRQHVRGAGAPEQLISSVVCLLDDTYRARIDGTDCDADIARMTARLSTPTLEKLIASLTTAIDSSYSTGVTGAKLALTRALATLGA